MDGTWRQSQYEKDNFLNLSLELASSFFSSLVYPEAKILFSKIEECKGILLAQHFGITAFLNSKRNKACLGSGDE